MFNGIINVYKEAGYTSRDAVSRLTGILGQRRIGHTGTLDPAAEGVLLMCIGTATKICELLMSDKKEYKAVMKLGFITDTEDTTGVVLEKTEYSNLWYEENITREKVETVLKSFIGEIEQIPPMYSAKKIKGKRLYELAREGKTAERRPSKIRIFKLQMDDISLEKRELSITVECSKGTYIRTLCKDIGEALGTKASMDKLLRTRTGDFNLNQSIKLDEIEKIKKEGRLDEILIPIEEIFSNLSEFKLISHESLLMDNGAPLPYSKIASFCSKKERPKEGEKFRMYNENGDFRAIYIYKENQDILKAYKMF